MKRVGVFGGAFNPLHIAHLIVAEDVRQQIHLDKILFVPYANPPHKSPDDLLDSSHRIKMIHLAIEGNDYFELSDIEIIDGINSKT